MMGHPMCGVHKLTAALVWIGALNWGLVGAFNFNLVETVLGSWPMVVRVVYVLVGVSALLMLACCKCKACMVAKK